MKPLFFVGIRGNEKANSATKCTLDLPYVIVQIYTAFNYLFIICLFFCVFF